MHRETKAEKCWVLQRRITEMRENCHQALTEKKIDEEKSQWSDGSWQRQEEIRRREKRRVKKDKGVSVLLNIERKQDIFRKDMESMRRGRQSVRNYWVQLAELFQLVGLPSSVCGTSKREGECVCDREKDGGRRKWREWQEVSNKLKGGGKKRGRGD